MTERTPGEGYLMSERPICDGCDGPPHEPGCAYQGRELPEAAVSEGHFFLDAESLLSKWGFGDGDALDDWWWDTYDEAPTVDTDELLYALVSAYLVPALRDAGHEVEIERIGTNHNPVRARTLDGEEVDHYSHGDREIDLPVWVWVSRAQVEEIVSKTVLAAGGYLMTENGVESEHD